MAQNISLSFFQPLREYQPADFRVGNCTITSCPTEAGCHQHDEKHFVCLCDDLGPIDWITGLCPERQGNLLDPAPIPAVPSDFDFSTPNTFPHLDSESIKSLQGSEQDFYHPNFSSHSSHHQQRQVDPIWSNQIHWNSLILLSVIVTLFLLFTVGLLIGAKKLGLFTLIRPKRRLSPDTSKGSLARCIQQYVINPNYYSSSPDSSLKKVLQDIEIPSDKVVFMEEIGEGCFGRVYKGEYRSENDEVIQVAIKVLKQEVAAEQGNGFEREVEILSHFKHPNIVKLIGVIIKDSIPSMVFEYMALGDLTEILRKMDPKKSRHPKSNSNQSTGTMRSSAGSSSGETVDYSTSDSQVDRECLSTVNGTKMLPIRWMSPESIVYGKFTLESDLWSFGVVLWEIFSFGKQPYYGHSNDEVVKLILQGILLIPPEDCPECICKIMAGCWKTEPKERMNFESICKKLIDTSTDDRVKSISNLLSPDNGEDNGEEMIIIENYTLPTDINEVV
ncbi:tyrosine-protein kinase transmembrane receptor Ror-like isoform X2 [Brevipalpus obovatus]|uniref:tyrosine-protein kinase transmembrane receptor Ror-like isoform X2 n=1 Tax=Brevipalpus obovatus TaxID=246614 RepID=UPI003D9FA260